MENMQNIMKNAESSIKEAAGIIGRRDLKALMTCNADMLENVFIILLYDHFINMDAKNMNPTQRTLYLCMRFVDLCQSDGLTAAADDEEMFFLLPEMQKALEDIGAEKTAGLLGCFLELLPEECFGEHILPEPDWYTCDSEIEDRVNEIDEGIKAFPDGMLYLLYREYLCDEANLNSLFLNI